MSLRHRFRLFLVVFGLLSAILTTSSVAAASAAHSSPPPLPISGNITLIDSPQDYDSPDAVSFDVASDVTDLIQVHYVIVTGELVDEENELYEYPYQLEWVPEFEFPGVAAIEMAINPSAHTQLLAVGFLDAAGLEKRDTTETKSSSAPGGYTSSSALFVRPAVSYHDVQVNHTTAWYDIVNIEVNQDVDWVNYSYGPLNAGAYSAYNLTWQNTATGWYLYSSSGGTAVGPSTINHSSTVRFRNVPFCSYLETNVYYTHNWVTLNKNTHAVSGGINSTYATGPCSGLLHYADWIEIYEQSG